MKSKMLLLDAQATAILELFAVRPTMPMWIVALFIDV